MLITKVLKDETIIVDNDILLNCSEVLKIWSLLSSLLLIATIYIKYINMIPHKNSLAKKWELISIRLF